MFSLIIVLAWAVLGYQNQGGIPKADVVLVIERASGERYVYTCNGRPLDSARVATGVDPFLRKTDTGATPMFVLFGEGVPLDKVFEIGALFEGKAGLTNVRYFAFSRKTGVMLEVKPSWDRWKVTFDGRLERIPWLEKKNLDVEVSGSTACASVAVAFEINGVTETIEGCRDSRT